MAEDGKNPGATPPGEAPSVQDLARRLMDLWQEQMAAIAADPDLMRQMARMSIWERIKMLTGMSSMGAFNPGANMIKTKGDTGHRKSAKERAKERKKKKRR